MLVDEARVKMEKVTVGSQRVERFFKKITKNYFEI